jgi:protein disulfide-isomerase A6
LAGLAKVAAIDCDDESNKPFCGAQGVQGFPTLKIIKPSAKQGRPTVEDYQGPRTAKGIIEAVKDKITNHVKKLQGDALDKWLADGASRAKAIVFTEKGTTSPLVRSLAIDFLGSIDFAQVRDKATVQKYGITKLPSVQLVTAPGADPVPYDGEINRESLLSFFSQVASPNPDPAPKLAKPAKSSSKKAKAKSSASASASFSKASEAHKSADFAEHQTGSNTIVLEDGTPSESPLPIVESDQKPMVVPDVLEPIPILSSSSELEAACLQSKSGNCILVLLPPSTDDRTSPAASCVAGFAEIAAKYKQRKASAIPMYAVVAENPAVTRVRTGLGLSTNSLEIIATNMKRSWWRKYPSESFEVLDLEAFVDAIKLGEGVKQKLPASFAIADDGSTDSTRATEPVAEPEPEVVPLPSGTEEASLSAEPEPASTASLASDHDEL